MDSITCINKNLMTIRRQINSLIEDENNMPPTVEAERLLCLIGRPLFVSAFEPDYSRRKLILDPDYISAHISHQSAKITIERRWNNGKIEICITDSRDIHLIEKKIIAAYIGEKLGLILKGSGLKFAEAMTLIGDENYQILLRASYYVNGIPINIINCNSLKEIYREIAKEMAYAE